MPDSCFTKAGFVPVARPEPEPSSPQAETVELTASFARLRAALMSLSWHVPQAEQTHSRIHRLGDAIQQRLVFRRAPPVETSREHGDDVHNIPRYRSSNLAG